LVFGAALQVIRITSKEVIYLKSALVGLAAVLAAIGVLLLPVLAASSIGIGFDVPNWHFVLPVCWSATLLVFAIAFVLALRWFRKRAGRQPQA